jgi:hypothetical protein
MVPWTLEKAGKPMTWLAKLKRQSSPKADCKNNKPGNPSWIKGVSGNPAGRPRHVRERRSSRIVSDLADDGQKHGSRAEARLRETDVAVGAFPGRSGSKPCGFILPCQPALAERPPDGPGWLHEIKFDGYGSLPMPSPRVRDVVAALPVDSAVLDGGPAAHARRSHGPIGRAPAVGRPAEPLEP